MIRFIVFYRPPNFDMNSVAYMSILCEFINTYIKVNQSTCIIGDLNCPNINWMDESAPVDNVSNIFLDCCLANSLAQFVTEPTRNNNLLDIFLCNKSLIVNDCIVSSPFSSSDHNSLQITLILNHSSIPTDTHGCELYDITYFVSNFNWKNSKYDDLGIGIMQHDWYSLIGVIFNEDMLWSSFLHVLFSNIVDVIPHKNNRNHLHARYTDKPKGLLKRKRKLYPVDIKHNLKLKNSIHKKLRKNPSCEVLKSKYKLISKQCRNSIFKAELDIENNVINSNNLGKFYSYVNSKCCKKKSVGVIKSSDGTLLFNDVDKANALNTYFASVCIVDNSSLVLHMNCPKPNTVLETVTFNEEAIMSALKRLKPSTACGPDGVPQILFKKLYSYLASPLSLLLSAFFSIGKIPSVWKTAIVKPIYKKGLASDVSNYRPISLTCVGCKVFELVIKDVLIEYLSNNNIISAKQHGFLAKHSTMSNLIEAVNMWSNIVDSGNSVCLAYIDFAKAFDTVSHTKLLYKLQFYGISGMLLTIIEQFLTGRNQKTIVGNVLSNSVNITSGVPQGSILGPVLFTLFINDLVYSINPLCNPFLFADDLKLFVKVSVYADYNLLQDGLNKLFEWSTEWQLNISFSKCMLLCIGNFNPDADITIGNQKIPICNNVKDLGILVDNKLCFSDHVNHITSEAKKRAGLIYRSFLSKDRKMLCKAFTTYVRPLLEYCSPVWSPQGVTSIDKIESVQRQFTKRLPGCKKLSYINRLRLCNLETLEYRRLITDLCLVFKIVHGLVAIPFSSLFELNTYPTRGHGYKLVVPNSRTSKRQTFFSVRVVNIWNALNEEVLQARTVNSFKFRLKKLDLSKFLLIK